MSSSRDVGNEGEKIAKKFLEKQGWKCLGQNIYTRYGEIDLIFQHLSQIIFVEVKFRKNQQYGSAQNAITQTKLKRIMTSASIFLHTNHLSHLPARIDLIAIDHVNNQPIITHLKNISQ